MAKSKDDTTKTTTGGPPGFGNPPIPQKRPSAMRPEVFAEASEIMFGNMWRAEVGRRVGLERSTVSKLATGARVINEDTARDLHDCLINKIEVIAMIAEEEDWPLSDDPRTQEGIAKIMEGVEMMREAAQSDMGEIES